VGQEKCFGPGNDNQGVDNVIEFIRAAPFSYMHAVVSFSFVGMQFACHGDDKSKAKQEDSWAAVETAFAEHIAPLVQRLRAEHDDPKARYAEFTTALVKKYLPDHRFYSRACVRLLKHNTTEALITLKRAIKDFGMRAAAHSVRSANGIATNLRKVNK
jgi:hypothetical protein